MCSSDLKTWNVDERKILFDVFDTNDDHIVSVAELTAALNYNHGRTEDVKTVDQLVEMLDVGGAPPGFGADQILTVDEVDKQLKDTFKNGINQGKTQTNLQRLFAADVDGDEKFDPAGFELNTGNVPVYLTMGTPTIKAEGRLKLDVFSAVTLSGSVALQLGATTDVVLTDGTRKNVTSMTIGGADISAFVGSHGPYWTDVDGDGEISWALPALTDADGDGFIDVVTLSANADGTTNGKQYGDINKDGKVQASETADLTLKTWRLPLLSNTGGVMYLKTAVGSVTPYGNTNGDNVVDAIETAELDRKSTRLNSSH